ncbi:hypothetical protein HUU62_27390 [Rhodoferax sp. 4810]|uniref:Uncharacterized protein n=1 Tax=Thiospirillum jenense TaxID=1653858 RepID=A0A839HFM2_9GAMM|nr:hypothetical protein [Thiospirillum jenense]MBB1078121.1 hypothetical protein [Rhodoferax jenense]MBB1125947.1 hypothetical protein [Thiospirillum jenense]
MNQPPPRNRGRFFYCGRGMLGCPIDGGGLVTVWWTGNPTYNPMWFNNARRLIEKSGGGFFMGVSWAIIWYGNRI